LLVSIFRCTAFLSMGILVPLLPAAPGRAEAEKPVLKGTWRGALLQETFVIPAFVISMDFTHKGEAVTGKLRSEVRGKPAHFAVMSFQGTLKGRVLTFRAQKFVKRTPLPVPGSFWVLPSGKLTLSSDGAVLEGRWTGSRGLARGTMVVRDVPRMALKLADIERAARNLDCELASLRAVIDVEAPGVGFLPSSLPAIRFQASEFSRLTGKKYESSFRDSSAKESNSKSDKPDEGEYDRLAAAMKLDATAALGATAWGRFQIMGFHFKQCGYDKMEDFVRAMQASEGKQLDAFVAFLKSQGLDRALREKRWQDFVRGYHGKDFASKKYEEKLAEAHSKHAKDAKK
jgi:hypothetical protein